MSEEGQKGPFFKSWGYNIYMVTILSNTTLYGLKLLME